MSAIHATDRAIAAIITGLRLLQRAVEADALDADMLDILTDGGRYKPYTGTELDDMCMAINVSELGNRDEDDAGCPKNDPGCLSRSDECHDACGPEFHDPRMVDIFDGYAWQRAVSIMEAFPERDDRDEVNTQLNVRGWAYVGGGAAPLFYVATHAEG